MQGYEFLRHNSFLTTTGYLNLCLLLCGVTQCYDYSMRLQYSTEQRHLCCVMSAQPTILNIR